MPDLEIIAWDSCIIIDAIQRDSGRYPHIKPMVSRAEVNDIFILVSTTSIAEVRYCKEFVAQGMTQDNQDEIISRWFDNSYVVKRNADFGICELAAKLGRQYKDSGITPLDSIILATALDRKAGTLVTYDDKLHNLDGEVGSPALRIKLPEDYSPQDQQLLSL